MNTVEMKVLKKDTEDDFCNFKDQGKEPPNDGDTFQPQSGATIDRDLEVLGNTSREFSLAE